jgi:hypothetical protein
MAYLRIFSGDSPPEQLELSFERIRVSSRKNRLLALLVLDLDRFEEINDTPVVSQQRLGTVRGCVD